MRLLCDAMLARLARWLRAAGYDTELRSEGTDHDLIECCRAEERVLVTRDRHLARYAGAGSRTVLLVAETVDAQARSLAQTLDIDWMLDPFSRCLVDNVPLQPASNEDRTRLPERARGLAGPFRVCPHCGRLYWPGSHVRRMQRQLEHWRDVSTE